MTLGTYSVPKAFLQRSFTLLVLDSPPSHKNINERNKRDSVPITTGVKPSSNSTPFLSTQVPDPYFTKETESIRQTLLSSPCLEINLKRHPPSSHITSSFPDSKESFH